MSAVKRLTSEGSPPLASMKALASGHFLEWTRYTAGVALHEYLIRFRIGKWLKSHRTDGSCT